MSLAFRPPSSVAQCDRRLAASARAAAVVAALLVSSCSMLFRVDDTTGGTVDASPPDAALADAPASPDGSGPTNGLLAHWAFDEGSGTIAGDDSANHLDATISGATWTTGKIGQALLFDGAKDFVATSIASPPLGSSYTLSLWVRLDAPIPAGTEQLLVGSLNATLVLDATSGEWRFAWNDSASSTDQLVVARSNDAGIWHHISATHDGATANLYVDHVLRGSKTKGSVSYDGKEFNIGADARFSTSYTRGAIDDVRVYTRALSAGEITLL